MFPLFFLEEKKFFKCLIDLKFVALQVQLIVLYKEPLWAYTHTVIMSAQIIAIFNNYCIFSVTFMFWEHCLNTSKYSECYVSWIGWNNFRFPNSTVMAGLPVLGQRATHHTHIHHSNSFKSNTHTLPSSNVYQNNDQNVSFYQLMLWPYGLWD